MQSDHKPGASRWWTFGPIVVLTVLFMVVELGHADRTAFLFINDIGRHLPPIAIAAITNIGNGFVALVSLLPFVHRYPRVVWAAILGAPIGAALTHLPKILVETTRPPGVLASDTFNLIGPAFFKESFPSGHSSTIALLVGVWIFSLRDIRMKVALLILAVIVGVSRIAIGLHWPRDVLVGLAIGWIAAISGIYLSSRWSWIESISAERSLLVFLTFAAMLLAIDGAEQPLVRAEFQVLGAIAAVSGLAILWRSRNRQSL